MNPITIEKSVTNEIITCLYRKLADKGLIENEVDRVFKDVFKIFKEEEAGDLAEINTRLRNMGWQDQLIDEHISNLFIFLFENGIENDLKIKTGSIHINGDQPQLKQRLAVVESVIGGSSVAAVSAALKKNTVNRQRVAATLGLLQDE